MSSFRWRMFRHASQGLDRSGFVFSSFTSAQPHPTGSQTDPPPRRSLTTISISSRHDETCSAAAPAAVSVLNVLTKVCIFLSGPSHFRKWGQAPSAIIHKWQDGNENAPQQSRCFAYSRLCFALLAPLIIIYVHISILSPFKPGESPVVWICPYILRAGLFQLSAINLQISVGTISRDW